MIKTNFADIVEPYLTTEMAAEYAEQTDKYLWVVYNILDAAGLAESDLRVCWIEDRLEALGEAA